MSRRALVVAIPDPGGLANDEYPSLLDFAHHTTVIAAQLHKLGYEINDPTDTYLWTARTLNAEVRSLILDDDDDADGVRVVHIFGHGELNLDSIQPVGADGETDRECYVDAWLRVLQSGRGKEPVPPRTLFVLDTCHSGAAADPAWGAGVVTEDLRGWVLAATAKDKAAYDGRLSKAVAAALKQIDQNTFGVDESMEWVPWVLFRDRVRDSVERGQGEVYRQRVTATRTDRDIELKFIPNPGYVPPGAIEKARLVASPGLAEFLDAEHFIERASGRPGHATANEHGSFAGRASQLDALTTWIDGAAADDLIRVVTGRPGAGKSALIGVLVCAAHPELRDATEMIWRSTATWPRKQKAIAAIHVRSLTVSQVLKAIAYQLELNSPMVQEVPEAQWTISSLIETLAMLSAPPLIVIDAVDESADVPGVLDLLAALATPRATESKAICRLLVGTRTGKHWPTIDRWVSTLGATPVVNLDDVPADQERMDLKAYFRAELPDEAGDLDSRLADALITTRRVDAEWGLFLVATLLAQSLTRRIRFDERIEADDIVAYVPTTLPEILHADLETSQHPQLARALITCLAWSKGDGMPLSVIGSLMAALFYQQAPVAPEELLAALKALRFYLRRSADEHGQTLYRPFHQSLIDYLRTGDATTANQIVDVLTNERPVVDGRRSWGSADPYLKRYLYVHAIDGNRACKLIEDTELLVHADPDSALAALRHAARRRGSPTTVSGEALSDNARALTAIYRTTSLRGMTVSERRDVLAMNAARFGLPHLVEDFSEHADSTNDWSPTWATGSKTVSAAMEAPLTGHEGWVNAVACTTLHGLPVAVTGANDVRIWDLTTGKQIGDPLTGHDRVVKAVACAALGSIPIAVTGVDEDVWIWNLATGEQIGDPLTGHTGVVRAIACTTLDGIPIAVTGADDANVRIWDLTTGKQIGDALTGHTESVNAVACTTLDGIPIAVTGGDDRTVRIWNLTTGKQFGDPLSSYYYSRVDAVACTTIDGTPIAVTGGDEVLIWNLTTGEQPRNLFTGQTGGVLAVACATLEGIAVAVTGAGDGTLQIWDLATGKQAGNTLTLTSQNDMVCAVACTTLDGTPIAVTGSSDETVRILSLSEKPVGYPFTGHTGSVLAVACTTLDGTPIAVTGGWDKTVQIWNLTTGKQVGNPLTGHTDPVRAVACTTLDGKPIAITGADDATVRIWNLTTGKQIGNPLRGQFTRVQAVACTTRDNTPFAVTASNIGTLWIWNLATEQQIGALLTTEQQAAALLTTEQQAAALLTTEQQAAVLLTTEQQALLTAGQQATALLTTEQQASLAAIQELHALLIGPIHRVRAVACTTLDGIPIAVTGAEDATVRIWDLTTGKQTGNALTGHDSTVLAVACTTLDGMPIAVTGAADGTVRIWDLTTGKQVGDPLTGQTGGVLAVACTTVDGIPVAITGAADGTVRIWDLRRRRRHGPSIQIPDPIRAISTALTPEMAAIVIGFGSEVAAISRKADLKKSS